MIVGHVEFAGTEAQDVVRNPDQRVPNGSNVTCKVGPELVVKDFDLRSGVIPTRLVEVRQVVHGVNVDRLGIQRIYSEADAVRDERSAKPIETETL